MSHGNTLDLSGDFFLAESCAGGILNCRPQPQFATLFRYATHVVILLALAVLVVLCRDLLPNRPERTGPNTLRCPFRLRQLGFALEAYHGKYKCYPPTAIRSDSGVPLLSWRVLLLPFMEGDALYAQFDLSAPWNSPHNLPLVAKMPDVYRCPQCAGGGEGMTPFIAVLGEGAPWHEFGSTAKSDFADGLENSVIIVELVDEPDFWTKPQEVLDTSIAINEQESINVLFADGTVSSIHGPQRNASLHPFFTISKCDNSEIGELPPASDHLPP